MPRFDFNHKTGMMEPRENKQIYFGGSMGGGLRIDDEKNNIKYVIERDGKITNIFGVRGDNVNLYDLRDARIISDRVIRMFGRNHKYSDFHYFLRGYRMSENVVKNYDEFVNENIFDGIGKRSKNDIVRRENGVCLGNLEDGTKLIFPGDCLSSGDLLKRKDVIYDNIGSKHEPFYISTFLDGDTYTIYRYDADADKGGPNMIESMSYSDDCNLYRRFYYPLIAVLDSMRNNDEIFDYEDLDNLSVEKNKTDDCLKFEFTSGEEYLLFDNHDIAEQYAIKYEKDLLESNMDKNELKRFINTLGTDFLNENGIEIAIEEWFESTFDDYSDEDKIDELIKLGIVKEDEEWFDVDEDGDIDKSQPTFDPSDYKDEFVEHLMNQIPNKVEEFIFQFGYDGLEDYIDYDKLAEQIVNYDGVEGFIASYDGEEREERDYYIYRVN